jgi:solute carrier family 13 (sodium-dependent dicarboxylate transporter), member 2/3/5
MIHFDKWIPLHNKLRITGFVLSPILFTIIIFYPIDGLAFEAKLVLGLAVWMALWWATEAIPFYATASIPLFVFPLLNVADIDKVISAYGDKLVFLLMGGFLLAKTIEKVNLHKRFALNTLKIVGTKPKNIILGFIIVTGCMSAWITNTATTLLILPIAIAVISQVDVAQKKRFATCLILCVAYAASLGGMATLIGTAPNALFASLSDSLAETEIIFFDWMLVGIPLSVVSLLVLWVYMTTAVKLDNRQPILANKNIITDELRNLGTWSKNEKIVLIIFVATAIAWITRGLFWKDLVPFVGDHVIVLISVAALLLLPSGQKRQRLLDLRTATTIPWGVLLLIGGGLALASGFTATGLDMWVADKMLFLGELDYFLIVLVIVTITMLTSELMSNTAVAALLLPIMAVLGTATELDPILLMAPVAFATSYGFMMPVGTPPNAIAIGSGCVSIKQMVRYGLPFDLICIPIVTVMIVFLLPLVWVR